MLNDLPAPVTSALRSIRTLVLRAASPLESLHRRILRLPALPPLWLRRHVGDPRAFESSSRDMLAFLRDRGLLSGDLTLLDIGCGCGGLELLLRPVLRNARVVAFDVHAPSIRWARRAFRNDPRFQFHLAPLRSPYGSSRGGRAEAYVFPLGTAAADLIVAKSVFTHLLEEEARRYLAEIRRALRPGGRAVITAFLFDRSAPTPLFSHASDDGLLRWRVRSHPRAAVAYERSFFDAMLQEAELEVVEFVRGFWPGEASRLTGQDSMVLRIVGGKGEPDVGRLPAQ
jgi:SAM-dependent methyltransferase